MLDLRNPHSILAALQTRPKGVTEIRLFSRRPGRRWEEISRLANARGVPVRTVKVGTESRLHSRPEQTEATERTGAGQATVEERAAVTLNELFGSVRHGQETGHNELGLWLALDQIQDPHNVGAIFRTAAFFGVQGILLTRDRSAPLTDTVYDVAAGGLENIPFCRPANLSRALEAAKEAGLWVLGTSEHANLDVQQIPRDRPWLLVLGNEEKGLRRLTRDKCDELCRIPPHGPVTSLNVSVAAGILMAALTASRLNL